MPEVVIFYLLSGVAIVASALVIGQRNPMYSVLLLVASFGALAGLYIQLDAPFVAVAQIIIYAGAVMVLFLFIIMLLDLRAEQRRKFNKIGIIAGALVAFAFMLQLVGVIHGFPRGQREFPPLKAIAPGEQLSDLHHVGRALFSDYTLPFQVVGVLILVATISVIVISKRELK